MNEKINCVSRREFIKKSSFAGTSLIATSGMSMTLENTVVKDPKSLLHIRPRYHRWHVDQGVEWLESNTTYNNLDWSIPTSKIGIVMVDVWQRHYLKDTEERAEVIINNKIVPLLESCRNHGVEIIHAPSLTTAIKYENYKKYEHSKEHEGIHEGINNKDIWPPQEFKAKQGDFHKYARPFEPREEERQNLDPLMIHPNVHPLKNDIVIGTATELHEICRKKGILFLFYLGFNTNACLITRDYGALEMSKRGYEVVIIRDATTGMESSETHASLDQTRNAILFFEMFGQYSTTSSEMIAGLEE